MPKITANELRKAKACAEQVEKFEHLFPDGVVPTVELCKEHASLFDWNFAARNLLSTPALAQYEAAKAQARAQYYAATAPARAQYYAATAPALAQYEDVRAQAWAEQWIAENQTS